MKKLLLMLILVGMLIGAGGCGSGLAGSTALKVTAITGMTSTAGVMAFDKEIYEVLKKYDWFMVDPKLYMPKPIENSDEM